MRLVISEKQNKKQYQNPSRGSVSKMHLKGYDEKNINKLGLSCAKLSTASASCQWAQDATQLLLEPEHG